MKINKSYFMQVLLDISSYIILVLIIYFSLALLRLNFTQVNDLVPILGKMQSVVTKGAFEYITDDLKQELEQTKMRMIMIIVNTALILLFSYLLAIFTMSIPKGYIWSKINNLKYSKRFLLKYALIKIIWIYLWTFFIILPFIIFKIKVASYLIIFIIALFLYFTMIQSSIFKEKTKIIPLLKKPFIIGYKKFPKLIINYFVFIIIIAVLSIIFNFLLNYIPRILFSIISIILFLLLVAALRIFVNSTIKNE